MFSLLLCCKCMTSSLLFLSIFKSAFENSKQAQRLVVGELRCSIRATAFPIPVPLCLWPPRAYGCTSPKGKALVRYLASVGGCGTAACFFSSSLSRPARHSASSLSHSPQSITKPTHQHTTPTHTQRTGAHSFCGIAPPSMLRRFLSLALRRRGRGGGAR